MSHLRERLEQNVKFHHAASSSIGVACNEMSKRFKSQVWDESSIQKGYIAHDREL